MNSRGEEHIHTVHAERGLEANWEVDLAKKLEEYLLKICSGEITGSEEDSHNSINFAEAALLLQGSVQVYSRKVEYLHNLVLHALQFLSQNRQQEQEGTSDQIAENGSSIAPEEPSDQFWCSDDVPVDPKNSLDSSTSQDIPSSHFVKAPANLVVLEGDCLDTIGDGSELESYLLAVNDVYRDFILLDPSDAIAVDSFLKEDGNFNGKSSNYRGKSTSKNFQSPTRRSGESTRRPSLGKKSLGKNLDIDDDANQSPIIDHGLKSNSFYTGSEIPGSDNFGNDDHGFGMELDDSDDEDDPWKPLNPHEPGNLKAKPFKKIKVFRRNGVTANNQSSLATLFPLAKLNGTISPEFAEIWEKRHNAAAKQQESQSPPLYEKLRQSLVNGGHNPSDTFSTPEDNDEGHADDGYVPDFEQPDFGIPEFMDEDIPRHNEKYNGGFHANEAFEEGEPSSQASLEDLCRSHLDSLLASIVETEKQTGLAARVSSWKQKIERNLEDQDTHPPFDIHVYGERVIEKLSLKNDNALSFSDVVKDQEKHDVARTFSALLQLVNNGDVNLDRSEIDGGSFCYTAANPFYVRLLNNDMRRKETRFPLSKKRAKSPPTNKRCKKNYRDEKHAREKSPCLTSSSMDNGLTPKSTQSNGGFSVKLGKVNGIRCSPDSKRRRRSGVVISHSDSPLQLKL